MGITARAVLKTFGDNNPENFKVRHIGRGTMSWLYVCRCTVGRGTLSWSYVCRCAVGRGTLLMQGPILQKQFYFVEYVPFCTNSTMYNPKPAHFLGSARQFMLPPAIPLIGRGHSTPRHLPTPSDDGVLPPLVWPIGLTRTIYQASYTWANPASEHVEGWPANYCCFKGQGDRRRFDRQRVHGPATICQTVMSFVELSKDIPHFA